LAFDPPCSIRLCMAALDRAEIEGTWDAFRAAASTAMVRLLLMDLGSDVLVSAAAQIFSRSVVLESCFASISGGPEAIRVLRPTPRGSSTQNVEPWPTLDLTPRRPPLSLTIWRTSAKPSPVPFPPACRRQVLIIYQKYIPLTLLSSLFGLIESGCSTYLDHLSMKIKITHRTVCFEPCPEL
jgi:hypothetical protein